MDKNTFKVEKTGEYNVASRGATVTVKIGTTESVASLSFNGDFSSIEIAIDPKVTGIVEGLGFTLDTEELINDFTDYIRNKAARDAAAKELEMRTAYRASSIHTRIAELRATFDSVIEGEVIVEPTRAEDEVAKDSSFRGIGIRVRRGTSSRYITYSPKVSSGPKFFDGEHKTDKPWLLDGHKYVRYKEVSTAFQAAVKEMANDDYAKDQKVKNEQARRLKIKLNVEAIKLDFPTADIVSEDVWHSGANYGRGRTSEGYYNTIYSITFPGNLRGRAIARQDNGRYSFATFTDLNKEDVTKIIGIAETAKQLASVDARVK
jgi:hypothetical protein